MIIHDVEQNTAEWHEAHIGVISSRHFSSILTPKQMKLSASADEVANIIAAERVTGEEDCDFGGNKWTERGEEFEDEAASTYELIEDCTAEKVGFITRNDGLVGVSPDRLVGENGGLEIKCPGAKKHLKNFFLGEVDNDYKCQLQGFMLLTGREWWDFMSYHPKLPPFIKRVERDEKFISALDAAINSTLAMVEEKIEKLKG